METISRNPELLAAFHAVALAGSYTAAAASLGTSKSMLSKRVQALETLLRTRLFVRTTRSLRLTEEGQTLFAYSGRMADIAREADRRLAAAEGGDAGTLRLTAPVSLGQVLFPELLPLLRAALPRVRVDFDLTNSHREITRDGIDFALRASEQHHPDAVSRPLGRARDVVCASPSFLEKHGSPAHPRELAALPSIRHSGRESWNHWTLRRETEEIRVEVQGEHATNLYEMMRVLARDGAGLARLPLYLANRDLDEGHLVAVLSEWHLSTHPLYLVYLRDEYATNRHRVAKKILLDWFRRHPHFFETAKV